VDPERGEDVGGGAVDVQALLRAGDQEPEGCEDPEGCSGPAVGPEAAADFYGGFAQVGGEGAGGAPERAVALVGAGDPTADRVRAGVSPAPSRWHRPRCRRGLVNRRGGCYVLVRTQLVSRVNARPAARTARV